MSEAAPHTKAPDLPRLTLALAVVAAHLTLFLTMQRSGRHAKETLEITFVALPITPELQDTTTEQQPSEAQRVAAPPRKLRAVPSTSTGTVPSQHEALRNEIAAKHRVPEKVVPPVDWYAEAESTADALNQRERIEREHRSLAGPNQRPMKSARTKPPCPFEQCEPGWSAGFSVFETSKRGRIEKTVDGEVIRWTSNHCYQILVTPNILHRGMNKCVASLGKKSARGDLFEQMKEVPLPQERATDVP